MAAWSKSEYLGLTFGPKAKDLRTALKNAERAFPQKTRSIKIFRLHYRLNLKRDMDDTTPFSKIAPKFGVSVSGSSRMARDVERLLHQHPELWPEQK